MDPPAAWNTRAWFLLSLVLVTGWLLYLLAPVLTPFLISALIAYLADPVVDRIERLGVRRVLGVVAVFALLLLLGFVAVLILLPLLQKQAISLINRIPDALDWLQLQVLPRLAAALGSDTIGIDVASIREAVVQHWREVGSVAGQLVGQITRSGRVLLIWFTYLLLIPVVSFYLLRDWDALVAAVHDLLPKRIEPTVVKLTREIDAVLAEFLRGQLTVMFALTCIYTAGLWLVGLDLALFIGLLAGVVSFVPYLGVIVGAVVAGLAAILEFHDVVHVIGVGAVFVVGQMLEGMVLSPLLVGDRIGLHPVAVIFAVMAGGQLFGFFGVLLALPVAAVIVVLLRHWHADYVRSPLYEA